MPVTDRENTVCIDQAITVTAVSADSVFVTGRGLGRGYPLRAYLQWATAATAAGAATVVAEIIQADDAALTTNVESLFTTTAIGKATLVAGYRQIDTVLPRVSKAYIGFRFTVATGPLTAGTVDAGFVADTATAVADRPTGFTGL